MPFISQEPWTTPRICWAESQHQMIYQKYKTYFYVAVANKRLDDQVADVLSLAFAQSTMATRSSQWRKFLQFCDNLGASAIPASSNTVIQFLCEIASDVKHNTVQSYVSAINMLHRFFDIETDFRQYYIVKCCLSGLKRKYGTSVGIVHHPRP